MRRSCIVLGWFISTSSGPWRASKRDWTATSTFFDTDDPRFSLIELVDLQELVNAILGVDADVMTRASLHPMLRTRIEAEALRIF